MKTTTPSLIGGASIIAGVCVGAGMLGLPTAGAGSWTGWSLIAIAITMIVMTISGWMLLEVYKNYNYKVSFNTVTKDLLGNNINILNNIAVYFVGAILLYAYITSSGLIISGALKGTFDINAKLASAFFVFVFSPFVWYSTRAVDRISVLLILFMILSFVFGVSGLAINIDFSILTNAINVNSEYTPYVLGMIPVALTSFGYHHSVSSMRNYYKDETKAKYAILAGTGIALVLYFIWILSIFGNLSRDSFGPVIEKGGDIDVLLLALSSVIESEKVSNAVNMFSMAAILSSFIGVGLGVFDYLADFFNFEDSRKGRSKTWSITFLPVLILSLLFPFGFVTAISYAGAAAAVWTCIIPGLLVLKSRTIKGNDVEFKAPGGSMMAYMVIIFGILAAIFHFLSMLNILPIFQG